MRLNSGQTLSSEELAEVGQALSEISVRRDRINCEILDDVYEMILILGKANAQEHKHLVEHHLDSKDPTTVCLVMEVLCCEWGRIDDYLEQLVNFALGVPWDGQGDVREQALRILGVYLKGKFPVGNASADWGGYRESPSAQDINVLGLIFQTFRDSELDDYIRQAAYISLCKAAGKQDESLPAECDVIDLYAGSSDIDWDMLDQMVAYTHLE